MGGPFAAYSFSLPKPILHLLLILNCTSRAASLLLVFLSLRPPPPPPPSRARRPLFSHAADTISSPASSPPPPTPSSMKSQLPVIELQRLAGDSPATACVVCLASLAATDEVRELGNCRHAFHVACIDRWIDADGITCPLCRSPLLPLPEKEVEAEKGFFVKFFLTVRKISLSIKVFISNIYVDNYL
ncbi:RING-H2 finger protein ATL43 [Platanthera zijinensis]|uniref:RING-H2 finger protein ATL43 n=1 Tax=Platanthera zijinensis TaxID=2320716 RepID=A0AAP0BB99_9ASPA